MGPVHAVGRAICQEQLPHRRSAVAAVAAAAAACSVQSSRAAPLLRRLAKKFPRSLPRSEWANKAVGGKRPQVCKWLFSFVAGFEFDKAPQSLTHSVRNFQSKVKIFSK